MENLKSKLESVLFVSGDPVTFKKLAKVLEVKPEEIKKEVENLKQDYEGRGITLLEKDEKVQIVSSPENSAIIEQLVQSNLSEDLTPAALETLAVVAYKEPISREELDAIRGVNSIFSLRTLLIRGLIQKETKNQKISYKTTLDFLKKLGISEVTQLPQYEELSKFAGNAEESKQ